MENGGITIMMMMIDKNLLGTLAESLSKVKYSKKIRKRIRKVKYKRYLDHLNNKR